MLHKKIKMCPMGIEPTPKDFGDLCSILLSYGHTAYL